MTLAERDAAVLWHPYTQMQTAGLPVAIVRGEGALLYQENGRPIIDAISSWWVNLHGHSHPHIVKRIQEQCERLSQVIFAGFTHEAAVETAERLSALLPGARRRIFFSDDGSTAVEVALKMAVQYWHNRGTPRRRIIALKNGYHGDTFGAMAVGDRSVYNSSYKELLFDVSFIEAPACGKEEASVAALKEILEGEEAAAFIYEPLIQGAGGMLMYEASALNDLLTLCRDRGVFTIADEVMTGFGRTGTLFASEQMSVRPEMICLSKAVTGGFLPLGVTAVSEEIFEGFLSEKREKLFWHGHSFTGNAISCAAALANLDLINEPAFMDAVRRIEAAHCGFAEELRSLPAAGNVRNKGLILAWDVVSDEPTSYTNPLRDFLYDRFLEEGVLLRPMGNVLYILPPVCITDRQLEDVYSAVRRVMAGTF